VVDLTAAGAVVAAAMHLGVERIEDVSIEVTDLALADERPDVLVDVFPVTVLLPP
jgi:uncharacterized protein YggE